MITCVSAEAQSLRIDSEREAVAIGKQVFVFSEEGDSLSLEEVLEVDKGGGFEATDNEVVMSFPSREGKWLKFELGKSIDEAVWLDLGTKHLDMIDLYRVNKAGELTGSYQTGILRGLDSKQVESNTFMLRLLEAGDAEDATFYIRILGSMPIGIHTKAGSLAALLNYKRLEDMLAAGFAGLMIIMILYNSLLFVTTRDRVYILYSAYLLFEMLTFLFGANQLMFASNWGDFVTHRLFPLWVSIDHLLLLLFMLHYLNMKEQHPTIYRFFSVVVYLFAVVGALGLLFPVAIFKVLPPLIVLTRVSVLVVINYIFFVRKRLNLAFLVGWSAAIVALVITIATYHGLLPFNAFTRHSIFFGVAVETWMFSVALGERFNALRKKELLANLRLSYANEQLRASNESLDSFNYHVSHDLKTVLNNTKSLTQMLEKHYRSNNVQKVEQIIDHLIKTADEGTKTVQTFLELGVEFQQMRANRQKSLNVKAALKDLLAQHHFSEKVRLTVSTEEFEVLNINPKLFESIFLNLVSNSIKYQERFPEVDIKLLLQNGTKVIVFMDNGIGIDLKKHGKRLFKPFQRLAKKKDVDGAGIGLYLVHRIVSNLNGTIEVSSTEDVGTIFTIHLPEC